MKKLKDIIWAIKIIVKSKSNIFLFLSFSTIEDCQQTEALLKQFEDIKKNRTAEGTTWKSFKPVK